MKFSNLFVLVFSIFLCCQSCKNNEDGPLPVLGAADPAFGPDSVPPIRHFAYLNQDSIMVTSKELSKSVYIADFFFTSCPSICPKVTKQMLKIHQEFKNNAEVKLVSFTLDPKRDTPSKLKVYAENLGVANSNWHFLSGDQDSTMQLARDFMVTAMQDLEAPGGINHSGNILLVDKTGHIRAFSNGTDEESTPEFIQSVYRLLKYD